MFASLLRLSSKSVLGEHAFCLYARNSVPEATQAIAVCHHCLCYTAAAILCTVTSWLVEEEYFQFLAEIVWLWVVRNAGKFYIRR